MDFTWTHTKVQHKWSLNSHNQSLGSKRPNTLPLPLDWYKKKTKEWVGDGLNPWALPEA